MWKKWLACLTLAMLIPTACAEVYEGTTVAASSQVIEAGSSGVLETLNVEAGDAVTAGDVIGNLRAQKVFASQDGVVAVLEADAGDSVSGTVVEIAPVDCYRIYCTVEDAYEEPENQMVHAGEVVTVKCETNGTHRAVGIVENINGSTYEVSVIGGELYIGEVVYLYRDDDGDFASADCVGIGTVISEDTMTYEAQGTLVEMCVSVGEEVERGERLFTYVSGDDAALVSEWDGIVSEVSASQGDTVEQDRTIVTIVPYDQIIVEIQVNESDVALISIGDEARVVLAYDDETELLGTVEAISMISDEDGTYTVRVRTQRQLQWLGMSAEVRIDIGDE